MNEYYFIFIWMAAIAYLSMSMQVKEKIMVLGKMEWRWNIIMAVIVFLPVIHLASMGTPIGDTGVYLSGYTEAEASVSSIMNAIREHKSGFGFVVFRDSIKILTRGSVTAFRLILALCHIIPVIFVFRKYSTEYMVSAFLFAASGCHIAWMMNGLRQFLAVAIIFAGTGFIVRKRLVPAIALILLAATVHTSALVMLPVVFIVQGKAWNKKTMLYIVVAVIATFIFSRRVELMDTILQGTEYEGAVENWQSLGDDGANPIRVLVSAVPVILAYYARKSIIKKNDPVLNICVNMSIINLGIYLIAMVTSGIMVGRLPIYVSLYTFILLPYLVFAVDWENYNILLRGGLVVGYILYYFIQYRGYV
jgi:transmembrane protein EpsG